METGGAAEAIEAVVLPVIRAHGLTLVDLDLRGEWRGGGRRAALRVYIDKPGGVGIADCQRLSEEIGDLLDVANLLTGSYDLEVSSPGLDRELRRERELRWAIGKPVRVWTREVVDGRREFGGRLVDVDEALLVLAGENGPRRVPRVLVSKVRLAVEPGSSA